MLVSTDVATSGGQASLAAQVEENATTATLRGTTSTTPKAATDGMLLIRQSIQAQGIYGEACDIICDLWRDSTKKQYGTYIRRWAAFCVKRNKNPLSAPVAVVLEFLTELYNLGLGYSAINTARSAVSAVLHVENHKAMAFHPLVVRFMKGFFEKRTPVAKYEILWDVS